MRNFNGNIQNFENTVIEDYIDPFSIPNVKILASNGRDFLNIPSLTQGKYILRNHTNLGDGLGYPLFTQNNGLLKSNGFKVGVAGGSGTNVSFNAITDATTYTYITFFLHFKVNLANQINQEILFYQSASGGAAQDEFVVSAHVGNNLVDGKLRIKVDKQDTNLNYIDFTSSLPLLDNTEYTICVKKDSSDKVKLFVNGVLQVVSSESVVPTFKTDVIHKFNSAPSPGDVTFGNYLMALDEITDKQVAQLHTKILNLGYL